ncbi:MAG: hypothetical protein DRG78_22155 [Epsilonproteobacteria bacterium]|nr:MAG: hypothetical protein DRG78_22155 [Campylobacterota bacterium]
MKLKRKAIALLITLFFIMLITISIGIGLKQMKMAAREVKNESFMLQNSVILDDVMQLLNNSKELSDINSSEDLQLVFDTVSFPIVPLGNSGIKVGINLSSARTKFNINSIADENATVKEAFESYLGSKMIEVEYLDMIEDVIVGIRADGNYKTDIFYENKHLFKDEDNYITSLQNLNEINNYYKKTYNNNKIDIINFKNMFSFTKDNNYALDVNCATQESLEILGFVQRDIYIDDEEEVIEDENFCSSVLCDSLTEIQREELAGYRATCTPQMYIDVVLDIMSDESSATIKFEYNLVTKKGSSFVYEI